MTKNILKNLRFCVADIETMQMGFNGFSLGKCIVRSDALQHNRIYSDIICIQYWLSTEQKYKVLTWIGEHDSSAAIVKQFDEILKKHNIDIIIGKNSDSFDWKHLNTQRLLHGLDPMPNWNVASTREDLQKQFKRHFYLPSYSLDYISTLLGYGGKDKDVGLKDWQCIRDLKEALKLEKDLSVQIEDDSTRRKVLNTICKQYYGKTFCQVRDQGWDSHTTMVKYGVKDVEDTVRGWFAVRKYLSGMHTNVGRLAGNKDGNYIRCKVCGSANLIRNGIDTRSASPRQKFFCNDCKSHAGSAAILSNGNIGKVQ